MADDPHLVGDRIAYHRKRLGLSQVDFAGLVGRSESWVSQVERGVRPVDRMSVLQKVADVLNVPVSELRGEDDDQAEAAERPEAFDLIRSALIGHPALAFLLNPKPVAITDPAPLLNQSAQIWELVHASRYTDLAPDLAALILGLEFTLRAVNDDKTRGRARAALADTYQATAAMMAKLGEGDTAWIAADRAAARPKPAATPSPSQPACTAWPTSSSALTRSARPSKSAQPPPRPSNPAPTPGTDPGGAIPVRRLPARPRHHRGTRQRPDRRLPSPRPRPTGS